ncbi:MAG: bifunctional glutamate N-acetyltransferase/amino-acid acetyltransferase ArgJ [Pseudomonadota bacterium]
MSARSPLAPSNVATLPPLEGVRIGTAQAGIKQTGRKDLMVMAFDRPAAVAGVFTKSKTSSAAVQWCQKNVGRGTAAGVVVNAGNANAFTGVKGHRTVEITAEEAAKHLDCQTEDVFLASTGVIGEPLDPAKFEAVLGQTIAGAVTDGWDDAAEAIMTTDTFPKLATASAEIGGETFTINGIAKGSGMIAPDMATMLSFIVSDAPIPAAVMQPMLESAVAKSFNAITVDSDTSTSDTVLLFSTSERTIRPEMEDQSDPRLSGFQGALNSLCLDLAQQIVKDGEGASKFVTVDVRGAETDASAKAIAMAIANSPLVKTAIAGEDANWGRIVMAVGKAGEPADRDRLSIWFGDIRVAHLGERDPAYDEEVVSAYMTGEEIEIGVDIGLSDGAFTAFTCDFTHGYISINADYRS